jgi:hypothetical protein
VRESVNRAEGGDILADDRKTDGTVAVVGDGESVGRRRGRDEKDLGRVEQKLA